MIKLQLLLLSLLTTTLVFGQIEIIDYSETDENITLHFQIRNGQVQEGTHGDYLSLPSSHPSMEAGMPEFRHQTFQLNTSQYDLRDLEIVSVQKNEIPGVNLTPSRGSLTLEEMRSTPFEKGAVYQQDQFVGETVQLLSSYQIQSTKGTPIRVTPYRYNPVSQVLEEYTEITVRLTKSVQKRAAAAPHSSLPFVSFINPLPKVRSANSAQQPEKIVFVSPTAYLSTLTPLIQWKKQKGFSTQLVEIGPEATSDSIFTVVSDIYASSGIDYLILVGDHGETPARYSSNAPGYSDIMYAYQEGDDHYGEFSVGRLSVETTQHLEIVIDKILYHERDITVGTDYFTKASGIASDEGPGDDGEMDFEHMRVIRDDLLAHTYTEVDEFYDGSQGGDDRDGNPSASDVKNAFEEGRGIFNYVGHGDRFSCNTSNFGVSEVNTLDNDSKLPFFFSVACDHGNFSVSECFGEVLLRSGNSGKLTGAIGTFMSSILQDWNPPMAAQDEIVDLMTEQDPNRIIRRFGDLCRAGTFLMNAEYDQAGFNMTDTWIIFGDPTLDVRTKAVQMLDVDYPNSFLSYDNRLNFHTNTPEIQVAISQGDELLSVYRPTSTGWFDIPLEVSSTDSLTICITGFNTNTIFAKIPVTNEVLAPYAVVNSVAYAQEAVAIQDTLAVDETYDLQGQLVLYNLKDQDVMLIAKGEFSSLKIDTLLFTPTEDSSLVDFSFDELITPACGLTDLSSFEYNLKVVVDGNEIRSNQYLYKVIAPLLTVDQMLVHNEAGHLVSNATNDTIEVSFLNSGHLDSDNLEIEFSSLTPGLTLSSDFLIEQLKAGLTESLKMSYSSSSFTENQLISIELTITNGCYDLQDTLYLIAGINQDSFESSVNEHWSSPDLSWTIDDTEAFTGSNSLRSAEINDNQSSTMEVYVNVVQESPISFQYKVSSEEGYDFLVFQVDGVTLLNADGFVDWTLFEANLQPGYHKLSWSYQKDQALDDGQDAAWIDDVKYPIMTPLSIGDREIDSQLKLFPNPAQYSFKLHHPEAKNIVAKVFDFSGRLVKEGASSTGTLEIETEDLESGTYLVSGMIDGKQFIRKVVLLTD